ncbi:unnamed protein product [Urochloa decumbens]|uniref:RING-type E3 ubiquitin transferase n=1 Tax=Urochloa decumbens TaxID=240449 RepID=A0ABC8VE47_9POAL
MAAVDCMTRACALAIATAACVGLPCALVYEIVRAAAARRSGTAAALSVFLVVWVAATAAYYPRVCADILRLRGRQQQARHGRHFDYPGATTSAAHGALLLSCEERRRDGGALGAPSLFVARHHGGGLTALRREPPARFGGARVVVAGDTTTLLVVAPPSSERCVVCLCDVEEVETAAWLPACRHMFHRHCIDQWLHQHGHSTCPICRCDAFFAAAPPQVQTV